MISSLEKEYIKPSSFRHLDTSQKHLNIINSETAGNLWFVSSLLPSLISYCISWYLETSPFFSFILFPFVRFSIEIILNDFLGFSMQAALTAIYKFTTPRSTQSSPEPQKGCAGLLQELVRNQEKTMFYTVTVNPTPSKEQETKTAPNLKWKCACALSKSQSVIKRTNSNSTRYYSITYIGEIDFDQSVPDGLTPSSGGTEREYSPVRIYINS